MAQLARALGGVSGDWKKPMTLLLVLPLAAWIVVGILESR